MSHTPLLLPDERMKCAMIGDLADTSEGLLKKEQCAYSLDPTSAFDFISLGWETEYQNLNFTLTPQKK